MFKKKIALCILGTLIATNLGVKNVYAESLTEKNQKNLIASNTSIRDEILKTDGFIEATGNNTIFVQGEAENKSCNEIFLRIKDNTEIVDSKGKKLSKSVLNSGTAVEVSYSNNFTGPTFAYADAKKIIVKNTLGRRAEILSIRNSTSSSGIKYVTIGNKNDSSKEKLTLKLSSNTEIVDKNGDEVSVYNLKEGMNIIGIHSKTITNNLPPQSVTYKVIIMDEIEERFNVKGTVTTKIEKDSDNTTMLSVIGRENEDESIENTNVFIDRKTVIVDEKDEIVEIEDIEEGTVVEVIYHNRSINNKEIQPIAEKIIVKKSVGVIGEIKKLSSTTSTTYITVENEYDWNNYSQIKLKARSNTKIFDIKGKEIDVDDLEEGMKILGIHSSAMTKSNPPQAYAYEIIVLADEDNINFNGTVISKVEKDYGNTTMLSIIGRENEDESIENTNIFIDRKTLILDEEDEIVEIEDIEEGTVVEVIYHNKIVKNKVTQRIADEIIVKKSVGMIGEITKLSSTTSTTYITVENEYDWNNYSQIKLKARSNTKIFDIKGKEIDVEDLEEGMKILGIHSSATTKSNPPQSYVYEIIVLAEEDKDDKDDTEDKNLNTYRIMGYVDDYELDDDEQIITIKNHSHGRNKIKEVELIVDDNTRIVDVQGNRIDIVQLINSNKQIKVDFYVVSFDDDEIEGIAKNIVLQGKPFKNDFKYRDRDDDDDYDNNGRGKAKGKYKNKFKWNN